MPDVFCSFIDGSWYVSGSVEGGVMISAPTLTEAIAGYVVALALGGKTDPVVWQLSPRYAGGLGLEDDDTDEHPADAWPLLDPAEDNWNNGKLDGREPE